VSARAGAGGRRARRETRSAAAARARARAEGSGTSRKDGLQGTGSVGEIVEDDGRAGRAERVRGRAAGRDRDDARAERARARVVLRRAAYDDAVAPLEGVAEPSRLGESDRPQVFAARRLVAEGAEREAVPEADGRELDARAALDVAGEERGHDARAVRDG